MDFLIARDDLHSCRLAEAPAPEPADGQALLSVDAFGLSANNITYAKFGDAMNYWDFFPADDGWGRMPVWGFAEVVASRHDSLEEGLRVYGYLPPSSEFVIEPARVERSGFIDGAAHRAQLPAVYNSYTRTDADPSYEQAHEDEQMLLRPLFFTSWLLDDFIEDSGLLSVEAIVISSASSKTASALAFLLSRRAQAPVVGLTSTRGADFTRSLDVYAEVVDYAEISSLEQVPAVYVDIAGDADVRDAVHSHYQQKLRHSAVVGATHHDKLAALPEALPGPRPAFFFAPDRVNKRVHDWGRDGLQERLAEAWHPYVQWTRGWLAVDHGEGGPALKDTYLELLDGRIDPARAHVHTLAR